jgi:enamine deaminase RidA (YjgF/YER057c/UK114 family)
MAQGFNPPHGCEPGGPTFSQGVVQHEGRVVYITGQVAWDENNEVIGPGDARAQMVKCMENIKTVLEVVGGTLDDIVSFTIYFVNRDDLPAIGEARAEHLSFAVGRAPVSIFIQVTGLVDPALLVELVPIAVYPSRTIR